MKVSDRSRLRYSAGELQEDDLSKDKKEARRDPVTAVEPFARGRGILAPVLFCLAFTPYRPRLGLWLAQGNPTQEARSLCPT